METSTAITDYDLKGCTKGEI